MVTHIGDRLDYYEDILCMNADEENFIANAFVRLEELVEAGKATRTVAEDDGRTAYWFDWRGNRFLVGTRDRYGLHEFDKPTLVLQDCETAFGGEFSGHALMYIHAYADELLGKELGE